VNPFSHFLLVALLSPQSGAVQEGSSPQEAVQEAPRLWSAQERAAIQLLRSLRKKVRPPDEELASRLSDKGDALVPFFFDVLQARAVPAHDEGLPQKLSEIQENVILLTMGHLDRNVVLGHVTSRMALELDTEQVAGRRLAAIACLGAAGRGNDFTALFELALTSDEHELDRRREEALRRAATSILERDPKGFEQLTYLRRITRPELLPTLVAAVGDTRDGSGLAFLSEVAYWHPNLILDVMCQVRLVGKSSIESVNDAMRVRLRPYLDEAQPGPCRAAIMALTTLLDVDSIGPMIALLDSEDAGLRGNALWALRTVTGLALSPSRETWARWHQGELFWLVRQKASEFQHLRSNDPATVASALRAILTHPLALGELRSALPELLQNRWPAIRTLACRTLAELHAGESVSKLVWALEDKDRGVADAAYLALKQLTGLDLPRDPSAWQAATHTEPSETAL
jgi:hypothetical protein